MADQPPETPPQAPPQAAPAKLKMHTPDFTDAHIARIAELFPNCVTEARDEPSGGIRRAIDFDMLRQELSGHVVDGPRERYHLDWPGKRQALLAANAPIAKTLRPCREESVDFDATQNLFIEGDNLDALKLLQETYLGKVKMIYIDPPYNTGNDFIYNDDFAQDASAYFERSQQRDEAGNRLVANPESRGRFHSDWLSMMYPRLRLARNLLREDGVIFISIDDNEVSKVRLICDEVFGADNFIAEVVWEGANKNDARQIGVCHEYVVIYARNRSTVSREWSVRKEGVEVVLASVSRSRIVPIILQCDMEVFGDATTRTDGRTMWASPRMVGAPTGLGQAGLERFGASIA